MELGAFALELVALALEFVHGYIDCKSKQLVTKLMIFAMEDATYDSRRQLKLQYSSQVTSPAGTREYHSEVPCEAPMLTCHAQGLGVTAWINTSHVSIFTRQQGPHKDQAAPRPAECSTLHPIVASHLRTIYLGL